MNTKSAIRIAVALALTGFFASATVARADDGSENSGSHSSSENNSSYNGGEGGSYSGGESESEGGSHSSGGSTSGGVSVSEAPLPLLGATPFAFSVLGAGVFMTRRNRAQVKA